jgi:hypothetical protein
MNKEEKKESDLKKNIKVDNEDGLKIAYDKDELGRHFPELMQELSDKKKSLKIKGVDFEVENFRDKRIEVQAPNYTEDLYNPGAIDFIRRCKNREEALEILDYLLERKELSAQDYSKLKNQIQKEGGFKKLITECGGLKTPGYYERKFPRKLKTLNPDQNENTNLD